MVAAPQVPPAEASRRAMIRQLYRWKSFWFGMLVIAFLGWAWARSTWHRGSYTRVEATSISYVGQRGGTVNLERE